MFPELVDGRTLMRARRSVRSIRGRPGCRSPEGMRESLGVRVSPWIRRPLANIPLKHVHPRCRERPLAAWHITVIGWRPRLDDSADAEVPLRQAKVEAQPERDGAA